MKKTILITITILFVGCISSKVVTAPSQNDIDRVSSKFPNYSLAELKEGENLYQNHCASCHGLKNPSSHNEAQWKSIVPRMVAKTNKKTMVIDTNAQDLILKYLITMSEAKPSN